MSKKEWTLLTVFFILGILFMSASIIVLIFAVQGIRKETIESQTTIKLKPIDNQKKTLPSNDTGMDTVSTVVCILVRIQLFSRF